MWMFCVFFFLRVRILLLTEWLNLHLLLRQPTAMGRCTKHNIEGKKNLNLKVTRSYFLNNFKTVICRRLSYEKTKLSPKSDLI